MDVSKLRYRFGERIISTAFDIENLEHIVQLRQCGKTICITNEDILKEEVISLSKGFSKEVIKGIRNSNYGKIYI